MRDASSPVARIGAALRALLSLAIGLVLAWLVSAAAQLVLAPFVAFAVIHVVSRIIFVAVALLVIVSVGRGLLRLDTRP